MKRYTQIVDDQEHNIRTPLGGVARGTEYVLSIIRMDPDEAISVLELVHQSAQEILYYQESLLFDLYQGSRDHFFPIQFVWNHSTCIWCE
jgi:hypothetical protein